MIALFVVQLAVPIALLGWMMIRPARSAVGLGDPLPIQLDRSFLARGDRVHVR